MNPFEQASSYRVLEKLETASKLHDEALIANKIKNKNAIPRFHHSTKLEIDKKIQTPVRTESILVTCFYTGSVSRMEIPSIPGKTLIYASPIAIYENCRGIAQAGREYLNKLDIQTLAAIFITMASNYDLLGSQPVDSGAQKNAIIRKAGKASIVDAIIMIETLIHTGNSIYLPRLSLILEQNLQVNDFAITFQNWLKAAVDAIYKPDYSSLDLSIKKHQRPASMAKTSQIKKEAKETRIAKREAFKEAKELISDLYSGKVISLKLKNFLVALFTNDNLSTADSNVVNMLMEKLDQLDNEQATRISSILEDYAPSSEKDIFDDVLNEDKKFADIPLGAYVSSGSKEARAEGHQIGYNELPNKEQDDPFSNESSEQKDNEVVFETPLEAKKNSLMEKIRAIKAAQASANA